MLEARDSPQARRPLPPTLAAWAGKQLRSRLVRGVVFSRLNRSRLHRVEVGAASLEQTLRLLAAAEDAGVAVEDLRAAVTAYRWERIDVIKLARDSETFDVEIGDGGDSTIDHSYIAEGIVTHNSRNAGLMATATLRFVALTKPNILDFEPLYRMRLLDAKWLNARKDEGLAKWKAPIELILQVHDSLVCECDEEDAPRVARLMTMCMDQEDYDPKHDVRMHYTGEAKVSRRWSKT